MKNIITIIVTVLTMLISLNTYSQENDTINNNYFYVLESKSSIEDINTFKKVERKVYEPTEVYYESIRSKVNGEINFFRTFSTLKLAKYSRISQEFPGSYVILKVSKNITNYSRLEIDEAGRYSKSERETPNYKYYNSIIQKQSLELMHQSRINRSF